MTGSDLQEILRAMQMLHERLLRIETWMVAQQKQESTSLNDEKIVGA